MSRARVEREDAIRKAFGFDLLEPLLQIGTPCASSKSLNSVSQLSQHRRTDKQVVRSLRTEPAANGWMGPRARRVRDHIRVQQDHSKSGGVIPPSSGIPKTRS